MKKNNLIDLTKISIHLSPEEIEDPISFVKQFFSNESNLFCAVKDFKMMIRSALSDKRLLSKNDMVMAIGFRDNLLKLVEAGWLLHKKSSVYAPSIVFNTNHSSSLPVPTPVQPSTIDLGRAWRFCPHHLTLKEIMNPFKVLQKFFDFRPLHQGRQIINLVFSAAISKCDIYCSGEADSDLWKVCDNLFKLLEAEYLVWVRLGDDSQGERLRQGLAEDK